MKQISKWIFYLIILSLVVGFLILKSVDAIMRIGCIP